MPSIVGAGVLFPLQFAYTEPASMDIYNLNINVLRDGDMPKRTCDICGKETEVSGGKVCLNGHFACKNCVYKYGSKCKICGKQMS